MTWTPTFHSLKMEDGTGLISAQQLIELRRKVYSISHDDLHPYIKARTDKQIAEDILNGRDLYHSARHRRRRNLGKSMTLDLPSYFLQNLERFQNVY